MGRSKSLAVALTVTLAVVLAGFGALASSSDEESFVSRINAERTSRGLGAVSVASDLTEVARSWSAQMASDGYISHDPDMPNEVSGWSRLGDNVGRGPSVSSIHAAFMNSDAHREIILEPAFTQVGVGVFDAGDRLYVTEIFVRRASSGAVRHHRTHRRAVTRPQVAPARLDSEVDVTGVVWEIGIGAQPVTVSVLEQLLGLDAERTNPGTGAAR